MYISDVPFTRVHVIGSSVFISQRRKNKRQRNFLLPHIILRLGKSFPPKIFVFLQIVFLYIVSEPSNNCSPSNLTNSDNRQITITDCI